MDVVALLRSKNKCLEKFLAVSSEFLAQAEGDALSGLPRLEERRDACLKAVALYDRKISEAVAMISPVNRPELVRSVRAALERRQALVEKIIRTDATLMAKLEEARARLIEDIAAAKRNKDILGRFKSNRTVGSGEGIDTTL